MTEKVLYSGKIYVGSKGEDDDALFLDDDKDEPFASRFQEDLELYGRFVSVGYWITDEPRTQDQLLENQVLVLFGSATADYTQHWSDYTGYLWTDAECKVGGHDLLVELESHQGRYCSMMIKFSTTLPDGGPHGWSSSL